LKRAITNSLIIKIISDDNRFTAEKEFINSFKIIITNFDNLSKIIAKIILIINIESDFLFKFIFRIFTKDIFNIEIEKFIRFQFTLINFSEFIQINIKSVTKIDI
jgi:hypothetical protein